MEKLTMLLTLQTTAAQITLVGVAAVVFTVVFLFINGGKEDPEHTAKDNVYKFRRKYFWSLFAIVVIGFFTSMAYLPFNNKGGDVDKTFSVLAFQWGWQIAEGDTILNFKPDELLRFRGKIAIDVKTNDNVEFIVTSRDVNHGFGIYNDQGVMVTQVQAMPGVNNNLYYKFEEAGVYKVICMEYCGISHHRMIATINVSDDGGVVEEEIIEAEEVIEEVTEDEGEDEDEEGVEAEEGEEESEEVID